MTAGFTNRATYWSPDEQITQTNILWEFDPVEVMARTRPAPFAVPVPDPELAAFAQAGVNVSNFQSYLATHELALIVSRDVTTRDHADHLQPVQSPSSQQRAPNHRRAGQSLRCPMAPAFPGRPIARIEPRLSGQSAARPPRARAIPARPGGGSRIRRRNAPQGAVQVGPDGSTAALVPARRAMTWQLTDTNGTGVVRERYWLTFAAGEIRSCTSCHGINVEDQADVPAPTNTPLALVVLLNYWKTNVTVQPTVVTNQGLELFPNLLHPPSRRTRRDLPHPGMRRFAKLV